jgi:hypothetical protein
MLLTLLLTLVPALTNLYASRVHRVNRFRAPILSKSPAGTPEQSRAVVFTCPASGASENPGSWKPESLWVGFKAAVRQLEYLGSSLPVYNVYYRTESKGTASTCKKFAESRKNGTIFCYEIDQDRPPGYGTAKIMAVNAVPAEEVLFLDCDTFAVRDPTYLFESPHYQASGAYFWPDIEGHFTPDAQLFENEDVNMTMFPLKAWWVRQGFDSGVMLLNKPHVRAQITKLLSMMGEFSIWSTRSSGDKDLWHLAWMLTGKNFTFQPFVGVTGRWGPKSGSRPLNYKLRARSGTGREDDTAAGCFKFSSQAKFDHDGNIVVLHQIWTKNHLQLPEMVLRIDLRTRRRYKYAKNCDNGVDRRAFEREYTLAELYPVEDDDPDHMQETVLRVGKDWWGGIGQ